MADTEKEIIVPGEVTQTLEADWLPLKSPTTSTETYSREEWENVQIRSVFPDYDYDYEAAEERIARSLRTRREAAKAAVWWWLTRTFEILLIVAIATLATTIFGAVIKIMTLLPDMQN